MTQHTRGSRATCVSTLRPKRTRNFPKPLATHACARPPGDDAPAASGSRSRVGANAGCTPAQSPCPYAACQAIDVAFPACPPPPTAHQSVPRIQPSHPAAPVQPRRTLFPRQTRAQHEHDAVEHLFIANARAPAVALAGWQRRFKWPYLIGVIAEAAAVAPIARAVASASAPSASRRAGSAPASSRRVQIAARSRIAASIKGVLPVASRASSSSPREICTRTELSTPAITASFSRRFRGRTATAVSAKLMKRKLGLQRQGSTAAPVHTR